MFARIGYMTNAKMDRLKDECNPFLYPKMIMIRGNKPFMKGYDNWGMRHVQINLTATLESCISNPAIFLYLSFKTLL